MIWTVTELVLMQTDGPALDAARAYELYGRFLWQTLFRLGIRESDLPDALQDVLVVVHRKGRAFDPAVRATTWLFAICRRVAAARKRKAYLRRELNDGDIEIVDHNDPERIAATRRARLRLERILDELNDDHRVVFVMFEVEGLSCPEIAEELMVPLGTIYSRLHAARQAFQKALGRRHVAEQREQERSRSRWPRANHESAVTTEWQTSPERDSRQGKRQGEP